MVSIGEFVVIGVGALVFGLSVYLTLRLSRVNPAKNIPSQRVIERIQRLEIIYSKQGKCPFCCHYNQVTQPHGCVSSVKDIRQ